MGRAVSVIGATGAVGEQVVALLEKRNFPLSRLRCFASPRSLPQTIPFKGEKIPLEVLDTKSFTGTDLAFFCAGSALSKQWVPEAKKSGCLAIDASSAFRSDPSVPLVIPEINAHALNRHQGIISSPNCAATVLLMPLFPIHRLFGVKRIVASTYQAASGAGARLLRELQEETRAFLENRSYAHTLPFPYAFNLYPHNSSLHPNGYVEEELKMLHETRKILEDASIAVSATCVRVPVLRTHSVAANVELKRPFTLDQIYAAAAAMPGLQIFEDRAQNRFATPADATGQNDVFCGRFRIDPGQPNTLEFWSVGDQLLKGAALNAVQIAETLL